MRKLASIQEILGLRPIEGADAIEVATVNNWNVVTKKGEYKIGDLVIYCEIDSFLPIREEFEFLRKSSYKKMGDQEGFRLRTIKLRGQISQGLLIPLHILPENFWLDYNHPCEAIGIDVSEILDIVKYEPPIPAQLAGKMKGNFPSFINKTDEERIQNLTKYYRAYQEEDQEFYATEKLDGSSFTAYLDHEGKFGVCSRNIDLLETEDNTFWKVARDLDLENKMKRIKPHSICLQGEMIGEGIQGNRYKLKGQDVYFFNVFDIETQQYYDMETCRKIVEELELKSVPIQGIISLRPLSIEDLLERTDNLKSLLNPEVGVEGIVVRSADRKISFKVISNKFLLNEK